MTRGKQKPLSEWPEIVQNDGGVCVTFANTQSAERQGLDSYADLLLWSEQSGALHSAAAERLASTAAERPADAYVAWQRALELRAGLRRVFLALAAGETPPADDIDTLNARLPEAYAARRMARATSGYRWAWRDCGDDELDCMLRVVIVSAASVLTSGFHRRVGVCAAKRCDLVFIDRTPGRRRTWCSQRCANRIKALKHYHTTVKPREAKKRREDASELARLRRENEARSQE